MTFNPEKHLMELSGKSYLEVKWRLVWFRQECPNGTIDTEEVEVDLDREVEAEVPTGNWIPNPNRPGKKMPEKVVKQAKGYARFRAVVTDGKGGRATATKSENAASFPDFIEKAETGAVGRALAMLGYGTQFTGDELSEEHRIVDAPVETSANAAFAASASHSGRGTSVERAPIRSVSNGYSEAASTRATGSKSRAQSEDESASTLETSANAAAQLRLRRQAEEQAPATEQQLASLRKLYQHLGKPEPESGDTLTYQSARELIMQLSHEYNEQRQSRKAS